MPRRSSGCVPVAVLDQPTGSCAVALVSSFFFCLAPVCVSVCTSPFRGFSPPLFSLPFFFSSPLRRCTQPLPRTSIHQVTAQLPFPARRCVSPAETVDLPEAPRGYGIEEQNLHNTRQLPVLDCSLAARPQKESEHSFSPSVGVSSPSQRLHRWQPIASLAHYAVDAVALLSLVPLPSHRPRVHLHTHTRTCCLTHYRASSHAQNRKVVLHQSLLLTFALAAPTPFPPAPVQL